MFEILNDNIFLDLIELNKVLLVILQYFADNITV